MSTTNQVGVSLLGQSGTSSFAGSTSASFITPNIGSATATSIAFSPESNGIIGTNSGDDAASGYVGEFIYSQVPSSSEVALTSSTSTDVTSISLTAGDWNVYGDVIFTGQSGVSQVTALGGWVSITSSTLPGVDFSAQVYEVVNQVFDNTINPGFAVPMQRISISSTTTVYLTAFTIYTTGPVSAFGSIYARRYR